MKTFNVKSSLMTLLAVSLVALFALGCGNSREDFVVTNNNTNNNNNGNLVFRFQQAAAQTIVPNGTATLRFDFFSTDPGTAQTLLFTETRPFASEVRFDNVSSQVRSVAVTSFGADGLPTQTNVTPVTVVIGNDVVVEVGTGTAATFDALNGPGTVNLISEGLRRRVVLGQTLNQTTAGETAQLVLTGAFTPGGDFGLPINATAAAFRFADNNVANISATGLITGLTFGANTTLTADYTALNTLRSADVAIQTFEFSLTDFNGTVIIGTNQTRSFEVAFRNKRGEFDVIEQSPNRTFSLQAPVANVSIDSATGQLTTAGASPGTVIVVVTYVDPDSGLTFTDTATLTLVELVGEPM